MNSSNRSGGTSYGTRPLRSLESAGARWVLRLLGLVVTVGVAVVAIDMLAVTRNDRNPADLHSAVLPDVPQLREIVDLAARHPTDADVQLTLAQCLQVAHHNLSARDAYS